MKKLVAAVLTGVMVLSAAACGAKEFDAKGYPIPVLTSIVNSTF